MKAIGVELEWVDRAYNLRAFARAMKEDLEVEILDAVKPEAGGPNSAEAQLLRREIAHMDGRITVLTYLIEAEEREKAEWDVWDGESHLEEEF